MPTPNQIARLAPRAPSAPKPDLKALCDAANEAAKRDAGQWFFFVTIMVTLAAIVGSTTHRVLFLEEPVQVPILQVQVPLLGFYAAAPAIFLMLHFYLLTQVRQLARKVSAFFAAAEKEAHGDREALADILRRLDQFPVVGMMAGRRLGRSDFALTLMVWATLAAAPLLLLLFVQVRFLPYHDVNLTLWHRALLTADIVLLWWLWPRQPGRFKLWGRLIAGTGLLASCALLAFSWILATIPEEVLDRVAAGRVWNEDGETSIPEGPWNRHLSPPPTPETATVALRAWLFDGAVDRTTQRPTSLFSRNLVLLDQDFLTVEEGKAFTENSEKALQTIARTRVLRGRDLRNAQLDRADLRRADLSGARLQGASLRSAKLQGASFDEAQLNGTMLDDAQLKFASLNGTQLRRASLERAQLQGASLERAELSGTSLNKTELQGALLYFVQLQGASLNGVQMQGASLSGAFMQNASFRGVQMQGASLNGAQLQGASLNRVQMQGSSLQQTYLQGAALFDVQLQGASLNGARLEGASLHYVQLQGATLSEAALHGASLAIVNLWRATAKRAKMEVVYFNNVSFDAGVFDFFDNPRPWSHWIEEWLRAVPIGEMQHQARRRLAVLVSSMDPEGSDALEDEFSADLPAQHDAVAVRLGELACAAQHAPYVARGILSQIEETFAYYRQLGSERRTLAARMLAADCLGASGLTGGDRSLLADIAAGHE